MRLSGGESLFSRFEYLELLERRTFDVLQPDCTSVGGISEAKRVADMASAWNLTCVPHIAPRRGPASRSPPGSIILACQNAPLIEFDPYGGPGWDGLLVEPLEVRDGWVDALDAPGLGVELTPDAFELLDARAREGGVTGMTRWRPRPPWRRGRGPAATPCRCSATGAGSLRARLSSCTRTAATTRWTSCRNFFLVRGQGHVTLVDTGVDDLGSFLAPEDRPRFPRAGRRSSCSPSRDRPEDVDTLILTHLHFDHYLNARQFPRARIVVNRRDFEFVLSPANRRAMPRSGFPRAVFGWLVDEAGPPGAGRGRARGAPRRAGDRDGRAQLGHQIVVDTPGRRRDPRR